MAGKIRQFKHSINNNKDRVFSVAFAIMLMAVVLAAACTQVPPPGPSGGNISTTGTLGTVLFEPDKSLVTNSFKTVAEYQGFVKQYKSGGYYGGYGGGIMYKGGAIREVAVDMAVAAPSAANTGTSGQGTGTNAHSETNNQVQSIDEADIIKTDGNYIYTVTDKTVFVVKAYPGEDAKVVSKIKLDDAPRGLFLDGNNLAVFGDVSSISKDFDFPIRQGMTFIKVYDISDKENPKIVKDYKVEGRYFDGRMFGDYAYLISTTYPEYRDIHPLPMVVDGATVREIPIDRIYYYNYPYDDPQFANIHALNMKNPAQLDSISVAVEGSQNIYMSEKNIYLTYTKYINEYELQMQVMRELIEPKLSQSDKDIIRKIEETDNDVLTRYEKQSKISQIIQTYVQYLSSDDQQKLQDESEKLLEEKMAKFEFMEYTVINKLSVDKGTVSIAANAEVPGHINNQFNLDEYNNILRVATTVTQRWTWNGSTTESQSMVTTLDSSLKQLDRLGGIAKGEQIFSTRFVGDRLYMVTFRQVDPFFVIDLKNPSSIKTLGQLKIPGFSRYLHPYDENTIIGIGRDSTLEGQQKGLKISLFDVSDVEHPKELAHYVGTDRWAQTSAEWEHKAFLFDKDKQLLVIPAYNYDWQDQSNSYNGALVFNITKNDIELRGLIDHSKSVQDTGTGGSAKILPPMYQYSPAVERSLFIEELLYTKSPYLLRINEISDLSSVKNIVLESDYAGNIPIY